MASVEATLADLETRLKALKGAYSTVGSALKLYTTTATFTVGGSASIHAVRFKFTPIYNADRAQVVDFSIIGTDSYYGRGRRVSAPFRIEPQDGSGEIYVTTAKFFTNGDTVVVIAAGTIPGNITMV